MVSFLMVVSGIAAPPESLCGEWTGMRPPKGYNRPNEQAWILTFRQDGSFSLVTVEKTPEENVIIPGFEGAYKATATNVVLQLPKMPPVSLDCVIEGTNLTLGTPTINIPILGVEDRVKTYHRTKKASELPVEKKQTLLTEGLYELRVTIDKDNYQVELKKAFRDKYETLVGIPISGGKFPIYQLQGRNIMLFGNYSSRFRPPEFSGDRFNIEGFVESEKYGLYGKLSGKILSPTKIEGSFKSSTSGLHGTFTFEMVGVLSPYPVWIQQGQIGP